MLSNLYEVGRRRDLITKVTQRMRVPERKFSELPAEESQFVLDERERRERVKELAGAVSTQANVANRAWVAMITVALLAVLPHAPKDGTISLPFGLGDADPKSFHAVVFSILIILCIAFAAAHAQQVRAQKLAQSMVNTLSIGFAAGAQIHPRELYDMLRLPSLNRVAPLAQLLRGKYQFYVESKNCPTWLRLVTVSYYALLKMASWIVYFILPGSAVWLAFSKISVCGWTRHLLAAGGILAGVALFHVFLSEVMYINRVVKELWGGRNPA